MNSLDIRGALQADEAASRYFSGVYPYDLMVKHFACSDVDSKLYVFNTHASAKPGEHWIAVFTVGRVIYYFDSFGRHPAVYPLLCEKFKLESNSIHYNKHLFQNLSSTACGDYCLLFCLLLSRGWSMQRYVDWLYSLGSADTRDHKLRQLLIDTYGTDFFSSYRQNRRGLVGAHKLHNVVGLRAVGEQCDFEQL